MDCNVAMDILDTISLEMSMTYLKVFVFRYTGEVVGMALCRHVKMAHLNSAEGIQNMCATQIMTKNKSLRTGFSSQVAH